MDKSDFGLAGYALMLSLLDNLEEKKVITAEDGVNIVQGAEELLGQLRKKIWFLGAIRSVKILRDLREKSHKLRKKAENDAKN